MKRLFFSATLFGLIALAFHQPQAAGQTVTINFTDRGWYSATGGRDPNLKNYVVGDNRGTSCALCLDDFRNFFVFDLSSVSAPIVSATIAIPVSGPPIQPGYISGDASENYELHDVVSPISNLLNGTGGVAVHSDLGSGVVYGSRAMTAADIGQTIEMTLNASAIAAMNSNHGLFGIGGSITTLDNLASPEFLFSGSNGRGGDRVELRLTLVPEPATLSLILFTAGMFLANGARVRR